MKYELTHLSSFILHTSYLILHMTSVKKKLTPVPFTQVVLDDPFWAPKIEVNRTVTIPHVHQMCADTNRFSVFDLNYTRPVPSPIVEIFGDSDPAKWIEAVGYSLSNKRDPELEALADKEIAHIVSAQEPSGYLNSHFQAIQPEMKWKNLRDWHEMYCAGHMIEGAVAYFQATGKRTLLDAMGRYADHIGTVFGPNPGQKRGYCGHPEIELALIKLARATGVQRYMDLAKYMIDERGQQPHYYDIEAGERGEDPTKFWFKNYEYNQSHKPIREQDQAVGHAVRAMYLFSAVADLADEYDDVSLLQASERIFDAMVSKRMYLTGGIGPSHNNEGFTRDYDLPDESAYAETCAAIGLVLWSSRMLQFSGDGKYMDVLERALFNGTLSGVSLDGSHFYYENPLASLGHHHRVLWFLCPCCPPNVARTIASVGGYFYSTSDDGADQGVWVHLYGQNTASLTFGGLRLGVRQETQYPWDGNVKMTLTLDASKSFKLRLRVPGWCDQWTLKINGQSSNSQTSDLQTSQTPTNGYLTIDREWHTGDVIEFNMSMPVQPVYAHPSVRQMQGRVALQRGPLVYCVEGSDHDFNQVERLSIDAATLGQFTPEHRGDLLGGVTVLRGAGHLAKEDGWDGLLYRHNKPPSTKPIAITAIPYYAWNNRLVPDGKVSEMKVWLRTT